MRCLIIIPPHHSFDMAVQRPSWCWEDDVGRRGARSRLFSIERQGEVCRNGNREKGTAVYALGMTILEQKVHQNKSR